jgi:hypothetical protein
VHVLSIQASCSGLSPACNFMRDPGDLRRRPSCTVVFDATIVVSRIIYVWISGTAMLYLSRMLKRSDEVTASRTRTTEQEFGCGQSQYTR